MSHEAQVLAAVAAFDMVRASGVGSVHLNVHGCSPEALAAAREIEGMRSRQIESCGERIETVCLDRDGHVLGFYGVGVPIEKPAPAEVAS